MKLKPLTFLALFFLWFAQSAFSQGGKTKAMDKRPNIIVIMVDDMGYSDLGCYGSEIKTPNLDALAASGMRMDNFYNCGRCCPTRASLLTGQYQHKVGLTRNGQSLTKNSVTIAEALKQNGYATLMIGKWHLSQADPIANQNLHLKWLNRTYNPDTTYADVKTYPVNRGFDKHYGIIWGVVNCYNPFSLVDGTKSITNLPKDYYTTHAFTSKAINYVNEEKKNNKPFFMYLAYNAPHWPVQAPAATIKKYEKTYLGGWDSLRIVRYNRLVEKQIINKTQFPYIKEEDGALKWNTLTANQKLHFSKRMATHAAMVDEVDQGVGKLINQLKKNGQFKNTVIFFMSDNGASPEIIKNPGYDRPDALSDGTPLQYDYADYNTIGSATSYTMIGSGWANALNSPYRYWKAESYNGGSKTPMFVTGPGIKKGVSKEISHVMDVMPTCLALSNTKYPTVYKGNQITAIDGYDLSPVLKGKNRKGYENLFFEHEAGRALISGGYKIVALRKGKWAMYNLNKDITETINLIDIEPTKGKEMIGRWQVWAKEMNLLTD